MISDQCRMKSALPATYPDALTWFASCAIPVQARLYVFYQPITVCGLKASPSGVDAGADHKESVPIGQEVGEFIPDFIGGLVRLNNPGAVELKRSFPEPRDAL